MSTGFKLSGFDRLRVILSPRRVKAAFRDEVRKATGRNALLVQAAIRRQISHGTFAKNSALMEAIKGGNAPLRDKGDLFNSVAVQVVSPTEAFVGILRKQAAYNIGVALHQGCVIRVSDRMRALFFLLFLASQGRAPKLEGRAAELFARFKDWKPISWSTNTIVIPPRPFIRRALEDKSLKAKVAANWRMAVQDTLRPK